MLLNWKGLLFWSNAFYGICAILLSIESSLFILHKFPNPLVLLLIYLGTILYYTHSYLQESKSKNCNERIIWYQKNKQLLIVRQIFYTCLCMYIGCIHLNFVQVIIQTSVFTKILLLTTGILSLAYYIPTITKVPFINYRSIGIFKSVAIAWVWTFVCCFVPVWLAAPYNPNLFEKFYLAYLLHLFLYVFVLAILFDIKDLNIDHKLNVRTIVLNFGPERTINTIVVPIMIVYYMLVIFLSTTMLHSYTYLWIQAFIAIVTYLIAISILRKTSILMNILLVDGLLVFKALLMITLLL